MARKIPEPLGSGRPQQEDIPQELDFEDGNEGRSRIGDLRPADEIEDEFPSERAAEAGMTGASQPGHGPTADDMAPETLLDDDPSHTPAAREDREPLDTVLSIVPEEAIGAGGGLDEEEMANLDPIPPEEHARRRRITRRHERSR